MHWIKNQQKRNNPTHYLTKPKSMVENFHSVFHGFFISFVASQWLGSTVYANYTHKMQFKINRSNGLTLDRQKFNRIQSSHAYNLVSIWFCFVENRSTIFEINQFIYFSTMWRKCVFVCVRVNICFRTCFCITIFANEIPIENEFLFQVYSIDELQSTNANWISVASLWQYSHRKEREI